ncbi:PAS domain-containing protein [Methylobacterium sp. J-088]|uniref:PAS domain-containing protein n=1 Tax=Methylobacterium sp. J-088 TaxID=2836664 RepID=UPI001FBBA7BF|nr:PAS domain-containing protein [Methylobacterium sp. J-088]MCJ2063684.1 PAS domain-containing protein [Methylobacterium sp. J-088]
MIFVTNAQGRATFISPEWTDLTSQSLEDAVGFGWARVVHPEDRDIARTTVESAIQAQRAFNLRYRMLAHDGRAMWVAAGAVPSFGPPNRTFLGFLGSITPMAEDPAAEMRAYGSLGSFVPPPVHPATPPSSMLEAMADHLLMAHTLVEPASVGRLRPLIERLLHEVGIELARAELEGPAQAAFH